MDTVLYVMWDGSTRLVVWFASSFKTSDRVAVGLPEKNSPPATHLTAQIDIYGLADATRRRANSMGRAPNADGAILSRVDLSTAVRGRPDLKVRKGETCR